MSNTTPSPATLAKQLQAKAARQSAEEPRTFGWTGPLHAIVEFEPPAWIYEEPATEPEQESPAGFDKEFYLDLEAELANPQDELVDGTTGTEDNLDLRGLDDSIDDMAEFEAQFDLNTDSWLPRAIDLAAGLPDSLTPSRRLRQPTVIDLSDDEAPDTGSETWGWRVVTA